jgi:hypothetical protein
LTSIFQFVLTTDRFHAFDLTILVQVCFGLLGFLTTAYLLRDRDLTTGCENYDSDGLVTELRALIRTIPLSQMAAVVLVVLLLPKMLDLEGAKIPEMAEVPAMIVRLFSTYFSDFQRPGYDGRSLFLFPLVILFVPRRCLSLVLLSVLVSGLVLQFTGLFSGSIKPASLFVAPSAFDLLSCGSVIAVITRQRRIGQSEAQIGLSAVVAGFLLAGVLVGTRIMNASSEHGVMTLFSAPMTFGVVNFIIEIAGTTLVSSLWWRDLGGMMEGTRRMPAH